MGLLNRENKTRLIGIKEQFGGVAFVVPGYPNASLKITEAIDELNPSYDACLKSEVMGPLLKANHIRKISGDIATKIKVSTSGLLAITYYGIAKSGIQFKLGTLFATTPDAIDDIRQKMKSSGWGQMDISSILGRLIKIAKKG